MTGVAAGEQVGEEREQVPKCPALARAELEPPKDLKKRLALARAVKQLSARAKRAGWPGGACAMVGPQCTIDGTPKHLFSRWFITHI